LAWLRLKEVRKRKLPQLKKCVWPFQVICFCYCPFLYSGSLGNDGEHEAVPAAAAVAIAATTTSETGTVWTEATVMADEKATVASADAEIDADGAASGEGAFVERERAKHIATTVSKL